MVNQTKHSQLNTATSERSPDHEVAFTDARIRGSSVTSIVLCKKENRQEDRRNLGLPYACTVRSPAYLKDGRTIVRHTEQDGNISPYTSYLPADINIKKVYTVGTIRIWSFFRHFLLR